MHVLLTSGGTKVPIDPVRDITNMSSGRFGANIATALLEAGDHVHFMYSKGSRTPFSGTFDFYQNKDWAGELNRFCHLHNFAERVKGRYHEYPYRDYSDYAAALEANVKYLKPEVVILAAAVSDYYVVNPSKEKVKSKEDLYIELGPTKKLIKHIKEWWPKTFLVGFKLLVGATEEEFKAAAKASINDNGCDLVVCNDLNSLKSGNHEITLYTPNGHGSIIKVTPSDPAPDSPSKALVSVIKELAR